MTTMKKKSVAEIPRTSRFVVVGVWERRHVTRNTVKTQAIAIYRKFGVTSRRAAIAKMHELGLLPHN